jgi:glycosyltransferase involved in cell wall biosynthesis
MEIIAYLSVSYLAVRLIIAAINMLTGQSLTRAYPGISPRVSILIPARNEERNIGHLLNGLQKLDYDNFEILVYDDDSEDRTAEIILEKANNDKRISYLHGHGPVESWLGKNHACAQLAIKAKGDYFLFLDADVRVSTGIINDSLAFIKKHQLSLLSIFPVQVMESPGEWLTVPLMNRILLGNLPLILIRKSRVANFAAANGQFMMFNAEVYRKHRFHEMFRHERVEDIKIIRKMKKLRLKVDTQLSGGQVSCRMYGSYREGTEGFSKNIHAFFGKNWLILFLYNLLTSIGLFAVWAAFSFQAMLIYTGGLVIFSVLISVQSKQSVKLNMILMPAQQFTVVYISLLAVYYRLAGNLSWKGRKI